MSNTMVTKTHDSAATTNNFRITQALHLFFFLNMMKETENLKNPPLPPPSSDSQAAAASAPLHLSSNSSLKSR